MAESVTISVRDVAARSGFSIGTVSNVLNRPEVVAPRTRARVLAAIEALGYVPNFAARQLRLGQSTALGFVVHNARNPYFMDVASGAEEAAREHGLTVTLGNSDESVEREARYLDLFELQRVRGVLISPYGDVTERILRMKTLGVPAVLVGRGRDVGSCSSVAVDDVAGGRIAVGHLLDTGRRRIAFAGGPYDIRQVRDRLTGAQAAVAEVAGATLEVLSVPNLTVIAGQEAGEAIAARARSDRPHAIFAANDLVAIGLLQAFTVHTPGIRVPDEIAVIGYDDIDFAASAVVPLSSIRQPSQLIGKSAVCVVLEEAEDPTLEHRHIVFHPELVKRESSRQNA